MLASQVLKCQLSRVPANIRHKSDLVTKIPGLQFEPMIKNVERPPSTHITTLENGVRVATENWGGQNASVGIYLNIGSRDEQMHESGSTYFLDRLICLGKPALELDASGTAHFYDSRVTKENWTLNSTFLYPDLERVFNSMSAMLLQPDWQQFEKARQNVIARQEEGDQSPREIVEHMMHACGYMHTPLENPEIGRHSNCVKIDVDTVRHFYKNNLKGSQLVVAGAGAVNHDQLVSLASKHFASLDNNYEDVVPERTTVRYTGSMALNMQIDWPLCYGVYGMEIPGWKDYGHTLYFDLLKHAMGHWDTTHIGRYYAPYRIAQLRGGDKEFNLYEAFYRQYQTTGMFGVYFAGSLHFDKTVQLTRDWMQTFAREWRYYANLSTERDLKNAKQYLERELLERNSSVTNVCNDLGLQITRYGRRRGLPMLLNELEKIDLPKFREVMSEYMVDRDVVVAAFGKCHELDGEHYYDLNDFARESWLH